MAALPCRLLGTFLVLSSYLVCASSFEVAMPRHPRRALLGTPQSTVQQYLAPHNKLRAGLGLPPLQWSDSLANFAAWWGSQRRGDCALVHSDTNYGENIFWGAGRNWQPGDAVAAWAAEGRYYNYGSNSCAQNRDCSHYTQMVWKRSRSLGCARVICNNGDTFIICNYDPHGNVMGQKPF